ncbi:MAG: hypothetical protein CMP11_08415 [Zetaproteobacteria bacterium]|nr:hypothetical protein [Pseudobdellovibrionaceae bacterium]
MKIYSLEGNRQKLDGGAMFGNAPRAVWEKWIKPDEKGRIELACRCLLLEFENKKILCEAGIGAFFEPKLAERFGVVNSQKNELLLSLEKLNIQHQDIDWVILSHLHFDHVGGILPSYEEIIGGNDQLLFPNANFVTSKTAFERCRQPHLRDRASFIPGLHQKLSASGRLFLINDNEETSSGAFIDPSISFRFSSGHTPGQMHTIIDGKSESLLFCGDLIPGRFWLHLPITMGYDRFPEKLIDEKKKIIDLAIANNYLLFFTHDPDFSTAKCEKDENGKIRPSDCLAKLESYDL